MQALIILPEAETVIKSTYIDERQYNRRVKGIRYILDHIVNRMCVLRKEHG